MTQLSFQKGTDLPVVSEEGSTEILSTASTAESRTHSTLLCGSSSKEVLMMPTQQQPLMALVPPDVLSIDENSDDVTNDEVATPNETDADREARGKHNKF